MASKSFIWFGAIVGSSIGGVLPMFFGGDMFGMAAIIWSTVGGILGIWIAFKIGEAYL